MIDNNIKKYNLVILPAIIVVFFLLAYSPLSIEVALPFLLVYSFAAFLEHPNINSYKESPRRRLAFVSVVFSLWNSLNLHLPEDMKFRTLVLTHGPGVIFSLIFIVFGFSFFKLLSLVVGIAAFELVIKLYFKLVSEDDL